MPTATGIQVAPLPCDMPGTILCVANFPANTGYAWDFIEGLFAGVATRLAPAGVRTLVAYPAIPAAPRTLEGSPAQPIVLDARLETLTSVRRTIARVRRERVDILYLIDRPARSWFYPVLRAAGVRAIIVHDHTSGAGTVPRGFKRMLKWLFARLPGFTADRVLTVSDFVSRRQREVGMIPQRRVTRLWNSVSIPRLPENKTGARHALGLPNDARVIACTCRATLEKGVDYLLRAFDRLPASPDTVLVYAGDGPAFAHLQRLRDSLPSRDRIHLLGYRADRELLLEAADICVVPSVWDEAFGLAALEAMVRGKPVVATTVGGIPEIIRHGETGLLVPPADSEQLASVIGSLLADPAAARRIGVAACEDVKRRFSSEVQVASLTALIAEWLPQRGPAMTKTSERLA